MAIKGKKKKGRSTARRPAGAPRTIARGPHKEPWHSKPGVRVAIGVVAALIFVVIAVMVNASGNRAERLERRQEAVDTFTGEIQALLQRISPTAAEMVAATPDTKDLAAEAKRWDRALTTVQEEMGPTVAAAPPELDIANRLIFQSVLQYIAAAKTYALVPDAKGGMQAKVLERARAQVAAADGTWAAGVAVLDDERIDLELSASGIRAPSEVTPPAPSPSGG